MAIRRAEALRRRQLDRVLADLPAITTPRRGWFAEVRRMLGVRAEQIAARLRIHPSAIPQFERAELSGSITLNSLSKLADAMDCRLVYAFVPRTTFEEIVRQRATHVAQREIAVVSHTMALEDQALTADRQQAMIDEFAQDLVQRLPRELWDEPA